MRAGWSVWRLVWQELGTGGGSGAERACVLGQCPQGPELLQCCEGTFPIWFSDGGSPQQLELLFAFSCRGGGTPPPCVTSITCHPASGKQALSCSHLACVPSGGMAASLWSKCIPQGVGCVGLSATARVS